ncbi:hypothetical protein [Klebsiella michiganensis]|uniref:hypothetical protein n=1 Tax=Klebsiella michiganensis TaxID=1134687 RepID=UPI003F8B90ED
MKPYFALSLLAVMCCNVGAVETQQTVVPHSADPILVTDGPQQDAALMNKAGLPPQPAEQPPAPPVQAPETTQAAPPSAWGSTPEPPKFPLPQFQPDNLHHVSTFEPHLLIKRSRGV